MQTVYRQRLVKLGLIATLAVAIMIAGLLGNPANRAFAQDMQHQTFQIEAGAFGPANLELVAFAPGSLKVHRGDTVTWHFGSFHNVHLGEDAPSELIIVPVVDDKPLPQVNPAVIFPTVKSGDTYSGGEANTGLPIDPSAPSTFSLVIDLPPGNYIYYCDVHPGMVGSIEVVADDAAIPTSSEVTAAAAQEISSQLNQYGAMTAEMMQNAPTASADGQMAISVGTGNTGRVSAQAFFAPLTVIQAGDKVTWTIPADSVEPHTVTSANYEGEQFVPMPQQNGPPVIALGRDFVPTTLSEVSAHDAFNSGFLTPGQSFTLTFNAPGVYPYACRLHAGMIGVVIVEPGA